MKILVSDLETFCVEAMRHYGIRDEDARLTAQIMVKIDTWGIYTHGTRQLRALLKNFPGGRLDAQASPEVLNQGLAWALIDGHHAMPFVTAHQAMTLAIEKAKNTGIGYVSVLHSSHFGAAGYYANMAASENMIGIAMCNADPQMTIPGASGKVLGTNPIAYAIPTSENKSVFLDIATSAVAASKILRAKALGQSIPEGWLVDKDGVATTDPGNFPSEGAMMPMAAHKGYGLALLVEVLCGVMTGAAMTKDQPSWVLDVAGENAPKANQGQMFMAINIGAMMPFENFEQRMGTLITYIHDAPKAKNADCIFLPGEMEWDKHDAALQDGLTLPPDVVESLKGLAQDTGITFPAG